ncbi:MAG TPA: branched-chain amino acid dehydrogenase [Acholeplasmataceae bacterium]|nr:MAG: branched-chain amino acid dehydrogenase [Tenericutes bacterium GWA2_38_26]OHE31644.1 MAG: branched-chain amino acid dehydrogenase [Tenericutes bacterium GWD2_38_27]OHE39395.1 MAG: branched-chain amino acid dehydrogenase [Tenericutes bacterium GWE2_38_8]OHE41048.1 MAG: branched-chain amino acid dehydrogenase [Tenericutes bacterium GWF2_38_8]HBG32576.1 branched-chain amino acid dehydrogenase [Acholeplasmataceae bacterium]
MKNKLITMADFVSKIQNGASVMIGGFMNIGTAEGIIDAIIKTDIKDLTIICNDAGLPGVGVGKLISAGKVKKLIASHIGLNPIAGEKMTSGEMEVELVPQGTLAERIRAGGSGLGGFLTPTGIGTMVQEGKQIIHVDGKDYLLEKPLKADFAFLLGHEVDKKGNIIYRKTTRNFNPLMATACETVVVQARNIVEIGQLDPDHIITPHIFVDYIVEGEKK